MADPTYPDWWLDHDLTSAQPPAPTDTGNYTLWMQANYAPATVGQLKNFAAQAKAYLDDELSTVGGAGPDIDTLVSGFTVNDPNNYALANLGQLKAVAKPIYDRLIAVGYNTTANLHDRGYPGTYAGAYPWDPATPTSQNYAVANLGQLKLVFSFDLSANFTLSSTLSTNSFGIYDAWLVTYGLDPFDGNIGNEDPDSDNLTNKDEFELGLNPTTNQASGETYHLQYDYDALGRLSNLTGPSISGNYTYDAEGNPTQTH